MGAGAENPSRPPRRRRDDAELEKLFGGLLRIGVLLAGLVVLAGGILDLLRFGGGTPHYAIFRGEPADLRSVTGIVHDFLTFNRRGIIQFGLLILIATPIARVFFAILAFLWERDFLYVGVAVIVLSALIFGLAGMQF